MAEPEWFYLLFALLLAAFLFVFFWTSPEEEDPVRGKCKRGK